jgi:ATP-dependent RNA helicase RhlB
MFDMGFIVDIRYLFRGMPEPKNRQSLLFSATMSQRVKELAYEHMNSPETIVVESEQVTADKIEEIGFMPANEDKIPLTLGILKNNADSKSIIFINTKHQGEKIQSWLEINSFKSGLLSGDVPQKKRERLLQQFKANEINILVATDVAARGLHIEGVATVINFDLPNDAEDYVHRIGRTARAGASGKAISLVCETFGLNIMDIESYIDHKIPMEKDYSALISTDLIKPKPIERTRKKKPERKPRNVQSDKKKPTETKKNTTDYSKPIKAKPTIKTETESEQQIDHNANHNRYMRRSSNLKEIPVIG